MELIDSKNHRCNSLQVTFASRIPRIPPLTTQLCEVGVNFFPLGLPQLPLKLSKALFQGVVSLGGGRLTIAITKTEGATGNPEP